MYFYFIIFINLMLVYFEEKNDAIDDVMIHFLNDKKKGDTDIMENILRQLVRKECIIKTIKGDLQGKLLKVDHTSLTLERSEVNEFVNLKYVVSARQIPLNKKGKKKLFYI